MARRLAVDAAPASVAAEFVAEPEETPAPAVVVHDALTTPDGLTACCEADPRALAGEDGTGCSFSVERDDITCASASTAEAAVE